LKVELSADELHILKTAIEIMGIKGKDAPRVAKILQRLSTAFEKQVAKDEAGN
tara:strand:+ start:10508 stop:10666 length:159 start_codon:yes stop_codon:yes gene_type:complete